MSYCLFLFLIFFELDVCVNFFSIKARFNIEYYYISLGQLNNLAINKNLIQFYFEKKFFQIV